MVRGHIVIERLDELEGSIQRWLEKNMQYIQFVVPIENALTTDPVQAMFCGPVADMQRALRVLGSCGLPITVLRTEYPGRDLSIVDVLNAGCSKGHALERWANYRRITREQVMAIGDNYNDIEMLAFAGHPFIMGNASEELRGRGWKLTRSNAESGVAAAIDHVLNGKELEPVVVDQIHGTSNREQFVMMQGQMMRRTEPSSDGAGCEIAAISCCFFLRRCRSSARSSRDCRRVGDPRNGFSIRHEHRLVMGTTTRLYFAADDSSFTDVPTAEITGYEKDLSLAYQRLRIARRPHRSVRVCKSGSAPALNQVVTPPAPPIISIPTW